MQRHAKGARGRASHRAGRAVVWVFLIALAAGIGAAVLFARMKSRFAPAAPNRELVPDTVCWYAESTDVTSSWNALVTSQSWKDMLASATFARISGDQGVKDAVAIFEDVAAKAGLQLTAENAMKVFGRDVAVALDFGAESASVLVLTKLDVDALLADFLPGETDRSKLAAAVRDRAARCTTAMQSSLHRDVELLQATRGSVTFHFAVLGDTLAASDDRSLLVRVADAHLDGGSASLAKSAKFTADMAALPAKGVVREWCDLAKVRSKRAAVEKLAKRADERIAAAAGRYLDATSTIPSYARSVDIPGGDLYAIVPHAASASAPAPAAPVSFVERMMPEAHAYFSLRDAGEAAAAWRDSPLRSRLAAGPVGRQIDAFLDDPRGWARGIERRFLPGLGDIESDDEGDDEGEDESGAQDVGRFEIRMLARMMEAALASVYSTEAALAVRFDVSELSAQVAAGARPDFGGRLLMQAVLAAGVGGGRLTTTEVLGRVVYAIRPGGADDDDTGDEDETEAAAGAEPVLAFVGDAVVMCDSAPTMTRVLSDFDAKDAAPARRTAELRALEPFHMAMYVPMGDIVAELKENEDVGAFGAALDGYGDFAMSWHVAPKMASLDGRWVMRVKPELNVDAADPRPVPRIWSMIPEGALLHGVANVDMAKQYALMESAFGEDVWREMEPALRDFGREVGVDLETQLLPALGPEIGMALLRAKRVPQQQPPVPGVAIWFEARQQAVVRKFVDGALRVAEQAFAESQDAPRSRRRPPTPKLLDRRSEADGTETVTLALAAEEGMPFTPALGFVGGHLVICLDVGTLDRIRAVAAGSAPSVTASPSHARLVAALGAPPRSARTHIDWSLMMDQLAEYADEIGQALPAGAIEYPDLPDDPSDPEAMRKWQEAIAAKQQEAAKKGASTWNDIVESMRPIDGIAVANWMDGGAQHGKFTIRFADAPGR